MKKTFFKINRHFFYFTPFAVFWEFCFAQWKELENFSTCYFQLNVHYTHTHRDKPQYECDECHTVFAVKRELRTHMRIHSGEQPHTCTQCGKQFGTRQLLKKHWMWHTGERSHVCPHCGKAFFQVFIFLLCSSLLLCRNFRFFFSSLRKQ